FAFSSSSRRSVSPRRGLGTMDAPTPLCPPDFRLEGGRTVSDSDASTPCVGFSSVLASFWSPGASFPERIAILWQERPPEFTPRFFRTAPSGITWGAFAAVCLPLSVATGGFHLVCSLTTFSPGLIYRFNTSVYSSVLCVLALCTSPRGNALPFRYLARRTSTRIGLQPTRSGDYPAAQTGGHRPPLQGTFTPTNIMSMQLRDTTLAFASSS